MQHHQLDNVDIGAGSHGLVLQKINCSDQNNSIEYSIIQTLLFAPTRNISTFPTSLSLSQRPHVIHNPIPRPSNDRHRVNGTTSHRPAFNSRADHVSCLTNESIFLSQQYSSTPYFNFFPRLPLLSRTRWCVRRQISLPMWL